MRFLICRTDAIGDLVITLPIQSCILDKEPLAEIFWLVRPEIAPVLNNLPGVAGVLHRESDNDLERLIKSVKPDVLFNVAHSDRKIIPAAKRAGVPIRVARPRGWEQILFATHRIWTKRSGSGRHESQNALDFLKPIGYSNIKSYIPSLVLTAEEIEQGRAELQNIPSPSLGVILKGSGIGAFPSKHWWEIMLEAVKTAGWHPIVLSPPSDGQLPPTNIRGLMGRLNACDAVIGPSTGPVHLATAIGRPALCLMGHRINHGPDRWAPLGNHVEILQYPGNEDDLGSGMDRLTTESVLDALQKLR